MISQKILFVFAFFCFLLVACSSLNTEKNAAAEINARLGLVYLQKNEVPRGKAKLLQAQKQAPQNPVIWYMSGYFLEQIGDMHAANKAYLHAIQLAPHLGAVQNNYGVFLCRQGKYLVAIHHFLLAVADPNYLYISEVYKNAGYCALKIPDNALANQYFNLAVERDS